MAAPARFAVDEAPRRDTSAEKLAALKPAFQAGRRRHRGELVPDRRRRRGDADRERGAPSSGSASSRARGSCRSGSPASTRRGCCTATRRRWRRRSRRPGLTLDDMGVIEINEAFASVVLQTVAGPRSGGAHGRRQPERRRHLARPSARRDRARITATLLTSSTAATPLRHRVDVRRLRHGDRRRGRARCVEIGRRCRPRVDGLRHRSARGRGGLRHGRPRGRGRARARRRANGSRTS